LVVTDTPRILLGWKPLVIDSAGAKSAFSNFSRQVGYPATEIAAVWGAATLYHFVNARFMYGAPDRWG
jgi:hypothetical protein